RRMSTSTGPDIDSSRNAIDSRRLLILIWLAVAATYALTGVGRADLLSNDDAMRLVQIRDFLNGQAWFDLTQYRVNPPEGVPMHWSRLIDLPVAVLISGARTVMAP